MFTGECFWHVWYKIQISHIFSVFLMGHMSPLATLCGNRNFLKFQYIAPTIQQSTSQHAHTSSFDNFGIHGNKWKPWSLKYTFLLFWPFALAPRLRPSAVDGRSSSFPYGPARIFGIHSNHTVPDFRFVSNWLTSSGSVLPHFSFSSHDKENMEQET